VSSLNLSWDIGYPVVVLWFFSVPWGKC